jgi:hypothetical protein
MSYCLPWQVDGKKYQTGANFLLLSAMGYMPRCQLHDDSPLHIDTQADDKKLSKSVSSPTLLTGCWLVLAIFASSDFDVERAEIHHHRPSCTAPTAMKS